MPQEIVDAAFFSRDALDLLRLLLKHNVRYLIVGGGAVILYGRVRLTGDVDVFYDFSEDNVRCLFEALQEFWDGPIPGINDPSEFETPGLVVQFGVPPYRIDLINSIDGVSFSEAWKRKMAVMVEKADPGMRVYFIGLEDLIKNKESAGRPKDLDDLDFLRRAKDGD